MTNLRSARQACGTAPKSQSASRWISALLVFTVTLPAPAHAADARFAHHISVDLAKRAGIPVRTWAPVAAMACEGEVAGKSPLQIALRNYVKGADPIPRRFLTVVGSDSALSEIGTKVLAEYGPTYYWAGSETAKAALREKLERVGPYPALLVVVRENKKVNGTTQSVRLGGHYVTGEFHGKVATSRQYTITCGAAGWVIKDSKVESES